MKQPEYYRIEALSNDPACSEMNLHLSIASFDDQGAQIASDYVDATPIQPGAACSVRTSVPAASIAISFYAVPAGSPGSNLVADVPALCICLRILRGETEIDVKEMKINRWGGTQQIGIRYS